MYTISEFQKHELVSKYFNPEYKILKRSILPLKTFELIDSDDNLTTKGKNIAISEMTLLQQCTALEIKKREYRINCVSDYPEINLRSYLKENCLSCVWAEGRDILLGIHACSLDFLKKVNKFGYKDSYTRYIEAQFTIHSDNKNEILECIDNCSFNSFFDNYMLVYKGICSIQDFTEINTRHIELLWTNIIHKYRTAIAQLLLRNPYDYRKGWPDLTVFSHDSFELIEVKHNDRLIESQINTFQELMKIGVIPIIGHVKYLSV